MGNVWCVACGCVGQASVGVVERWGRFEKLAPPGFYCFNPIAGECLAGVLSTRIHSLDVRIETKTKVFLFPCLLEFRNLLPSGIWFLPLFRGNQTRIDCLIGAKYCGCSGSWILYAAIIFSFCIKPFTFLITIVRFNSIPRLILVITLTLKSINIYWKLRQSDYFSVQDSGSRPV